VCGLNVTGKETLAATGEWFSWPDEVALSNSVPVGVVIPDRSGMIS
jgi:hypothetical protein